jgi:hypothetical protein
MTERPDLRDDDVLQAVLARSLRATDPTPADAIAVAKAAAGLGRADDELAVLVSDSLVGEGVAVRREVGESRLLTYATPRLTVDLELGADGHTLMGQIMPTGRYALELEMADAVIQASTDEIGRFRLELGPGWCRVRVRGSEGSMVTPVIVR